MAVLAKPVAVSPARTQMFHVTVVLIFITSHFEQLLDRCSILFNRLIKKYRYYCIANF